MDDILIDIFNGKQAVSTLGRYLRCWPSIEVEDNARTQTLSVCTWMLSARDVGQCCSNAGPPSSMVTYIGPASVWRLVVACANPVLHPDLTHSVLLCSYPAGCGGYSFTSYLSQFVQGSSQIEKHVFFLTLITLIFCWASLTTTNEPACKICRRFSKRNGLSISRTGE